ncbi:hypothetical protein SLA2020_152290 [Shorea laevis]
MQDRATKRRWRQRKTSRESGKGREMVCKEQKGKRESCDVMRCGFRAEIDKEIRVRDWAMAMKRNTVKAESSHSLGQRQRRDKMSC